MDSKSVFKISCVSLVLAFAICCASIPQNFQKSITFRILPPMMPDSSKIYIAGNHSELGDWDASEIALTLQSDGSWTKTIPFPKNTPLEFKITRGSWRTEAVSSEGVVPGNTRYTVSEDDTITISVENWKDFAHPAVGQITGKAVYHRNLNAKGIKPRDVIVWLPPGYDDQPAVRYSVLYMHDGQNVFDPTTSFLGMDWRVDEVADSLMKAGAMQEIIVVGIYNTGDRVEEYSDTEKGRAYMTFIIDDLKPMIDSAYRTLSDRAHTSTMGSSMGGLISFLLVWNHADAFSMAGCLSPAFIPPHGNAVEIVKSSEGVKKDIRIYMDNGGVDLDARLQPGCEAMLTALQQKGFKMGGNLEWFRAENAEHNEKAWAARVWRPLLFMFGKEKQPRSKEFGGVYENRQILANLAADLFEFYPRKTMHKIAIIPGDGVGIDVTAEAVKVLETINRSDDLGLELVHFDFGAERYLKTGVALPDGQMEDFRQNFDAIFLGALGDPRIPDMAHGRKILLAMRFELDLFINLRPVKLYSERLCPLKNKSVQDIDMVIFRENTEGPYVGAGGIFKKNTPDEVAIQESIHTRKGVERIIRAAFEYAKQSGRPKVTMSDKANVLRFGHDLWQRVFKEVGEEYPEIEKEHFYVDALVMEMVRAPERFHVIVTENMLGDIITDLGAVLQGGLGMAASGNINPAGVSLFEPVHGSAPPLAGKNLANPIAAIATAGMMLNHLGFTSSAEKIDAAIQRAISENQVTKDIGGALGTAEVGDFIANHLGERENR